MGWLDIPDRERDRLHELRLESIRTGDNSSLIWESNRLGMKYNTLWRRLQEWQAAKPHLLIKNDERPSWQNWLRITTNDALFISDLEVPDHNEELLGYAREVAKIYELDTIIWAGDIMAQDEPGLSTHGDSWAMQRPNFNQSIGITKRIFNEFKDVSKNQYFIEGNHDRHIAIATAGQAWFGQFFPEYENITFSRYPYMYIATDRGLVKVTHPKNFSENAINLGRNLINKNKLKSHIIMAHTHQGQRGYSKDGQYEILALGCMRCPIKTQYKNIVDNTFGEWQPGFAFMKDGYFYMLNLYSTNWKRVLSGYTVA